MRYRNLIAGLLVLALALSAALMPASAWRKGGGYSAKGVGFDGTVYLKNTAMQGTASKKLLLSGWIKPHYTPGDTRRVMACFFQADGSDDRTVSGTTIYQAPDTTPAGWWFANVSDPTRPGPNDAYFYYDSTPANPTPDNIWFHMACSADASTITVTLQCYLNDQPFTMPSLFTDGTAPFNIDLLARNFWIPDWKVSTTDPTKQDMSDLQIYYGIAPDLSVTANRRVFITAGLRPVDPVEAVARYGQPLLLFSGDKDGFPINRGTAGAFTLLDGSLTNVPGP